MMNEPNDQCAELSEAELDRVSGSYTLIELLPPPRPTLSHKEQIEISSWFPPPPRA